MMNAHTTPPAPTHPRRSRARRWIGRVLLGLCVIAAIGAGYETIGEARDRGDYPPADLVDVGGHRLHISCSGSGSPTVVLEAGLGATAAGWGWVTRAVSRDTRVCVYDRAGRGGSDAGTSPPDAIRIATDLHTLLERRGIPGPFVLAGHSSGALYVRVFADRYPDEVAGVVLLDGQPAAAFERLPAYPGFYRTFRRVAGLLPTLARLGVARIAFTFLSSDLPPEARERARIDNSSPRLYRSLRDEFLQLPASLRQAGSCATLGARPLIVVTATQDAQAGWLPLQDEMATLSTNAVHRVTPYTHLALVEEQHASQASIRAIRDVVTAVRTGRPLANW